MHKLPTSKSGSPTTFRAPSFFAFSAKKDGKALPYALIKTAQAAALAVAICFTLGASSAGDRFNNLGHRMMCTCGCSQLLGECNHVGCPDSDHMRAELRDAVLGPQNDQQILDSFEAKYGATVLAAPTTRGFNLIAWIAPVAVFLAALLGTILVARHWSASRQQTAAAEAAAAASLSPEANVLRDKIRRETGGEGDL